MNRTHEDDEYEYFEEPGPGLAAARALKRSGTMGWSDELQGALESNFPRLQLTPGDFFDPSVPTPEAPSYRKARDEARVVDDVTREANPGVSTAVELGTAILHPLNRLGGGGFMGAVRGGAMQGAAQGLGDSRADLSDGDVLEYVRAFGDTTRGAGLGAAFGGAGYGVGRGLQWAGQRGGKALDDAREQLFREEAEAGMRELEEQSAPLVARRNADAAARAKEMARLEREHGQGLEMNKAHSRRAAKEAERAAQRGAQLERGGDEPRLMEEPGTRTLQGYQGSAGERRAVNFDRVQAYRERLQDPALPGAERQRLERYVKQYGQAVDNPGAFERGRIEQELRKRYPREMVDEIMAGRVGPDGQIIPRSAMGAEPKTLPMGLEDALAQGRAPQLARSGGGGSVWDDYQPKTELVPRAMSDDPTRMALVRTSPDDGFQGIAEHPMHTFEFQPSGSREVFEVVAFQRSPGEVYVESVKPVRASSVEELHGEMANRFGAGSMKELSYELAKAFPGAERILGQRMTGANVGKAVNVRAPEVTQAGTPDFDATQAGRPDFNDYEVPRGSPMFRENLAREVEREGLETPHWQRPREPGERPLTPYENAQIDAQNPRTSPWEDTVPEYGYPPDEAVRYRPPLPEADDFAVEAAGAPARSPVLDSPPRRLPAGEGLQGFGPRTPPSQPQPTAPARPLEPTRGPPTRAERPRPAPALAPEPTAPAAPARAPVLGDEEASTVYEYLRSLEAMPSSAMQRAGARESAALGQVASAGYRGLKGSGNALGAVAGAVAGITRESLRNPAVRARALSLLRVRRLADINPEVWGRTGAALQRAMQEGPDEYAATVHVYNQTDPDFREAERAAGEGLEDVTDEQLEEELRAAGLL